MKTVLRSKANYMRKSHFLFLLKYILGSFLLFLTAFILLKFPGNTTSGIRNGIDLCLGVLIPGLYPFMVVSNIFVSSGLVSFRIPFVFKITEYVFRLPGECASVILFSMTGGLPVGTKMSLELYKKGIISKSESRRLMYFCVNTGPAFIISTVGYSMLSSEYMGMIIYISIVLSALTIGFFTRFIIENDGDYAECSDINSENSKSFLHDAVVKSSKSILQICAWVVIFSCINEIVDLFRMSDNFGLFLKCILEVTNGCRVAVGYFSVPVVAGVAGFSGICGHFQLMDSFSQVGMKYKYFLVSRIISGSLSVIYCNFFLKIFPVAKETFSVGIKPSTGVPSGSVTVSVLMIIMAVLFIVGDDYTLRRGKVKNMKK